MMHFHFTEALLPDGWARNVRVRVDARGMIDRLHIGVDAAPGDEIVAIGLPGLGNLHSHAFQRGMAGLTEFKTAQRDDFWTWRECMYAFVAELNPDDVEAIAALAYCEMLESGFTSVGEFHYLHHDRDGTPYADRAEMGCRIAAAADRTGIALTLLPVFYRRAGFDEAPLSARQARFYHDRDGYAALVEASQLALAGLDNARLGIAPHSLRAVSIDDIQSALGLITDGPVHIHIAEQIAEVEASLKAHARRPVAFLFDHLPVDERWCLVHATHINPAESGRIASADAIIGLCPQTEANLGDGIFPARPFQVQGGQFGIGTDSHIRIDLSEELRTLEYSQRLIQRSRTCLTEEDVSNGRWLFQKALAGGAQALNQPARGIDLGERADIIALDSDDPMLAGRRADRALDTWIFSGDSRQVKTVWVGGRRVVDNGRALCRDRVNASYADTARRVLERMGS